MNKEEAVKVASRSVEQNSEKPVKTEKSVETVMTEETPAEETPELVKESKKEEEAVEEKPQVAQPTVNKNTRGRKPSAK